MLKAVIVRTHNQRGSRASSMDSAVQHSSLISQLLRASIVHKVWFAQQDRTVSPSASIVRS